MFRVIEVAKRDCSLFLGICFNPELEQREKQAPCREPDIGLDPGSPGSCPRPKAALNH